MMVVKVEQLQYSDQTHKSRKHPLSGNILFLVNYQFGWYQFKRAEEEISTLLLLNETIQRVVKT